MDEVKLILFTATGTDGLVVKDGPSVVGDRSVGKCNERESVFQGSLGFQLGLKGQLVDL